jgi:hypothetical protein
LEIAPANAHSKKNAPPNFPEHRDKFNFFIATIKNAIPGLRPASGTVFA